MPLILVEEAEEFLESSVGHLDGLAIEFFNLVPLEYATIQVRHLPKKLVDFGRPIFFLPGKPFKKEWAEEI